MDTNLHEWYFMEKLLDGVEVEWKALGVALRTKGTNKTQFRDDVLKGSEQLFASKYRSVL